MDSAVVQSYLNKMEEHASNEGLTISPTQNQKATILKKLVSFHSSRVHPNNSAVDSLSWLQVNSWHSLLDPLMNIEFRSEVIKYGEFAQACYDCFEFNEESTNCGNCKYQIEDMLNEAGLPYSGYQVTKYLYATAELDLPNFFARSDSSEFTWSKDSNWMGYIAVSTCPEEIQRVGARDILVAWRGTIKTLEWIENLKDLLKPSGLDPIDKATLGIKVEKGFLDLYTSTKDHSRYNKISARDQLQAEIKRLLQEYKGENLRITFTGHSLGGALALLSAYDIAESRFDGEEVPSAIIPINIFTFCAPRVGNEAFRARCDQLGLKVLRVVNRKDIVPKVPGLFVNESSFLGPCLDGIFPWAYSHVGVKLKLKASSSPYIVRPILDIAAFHNLEALLHLLDGYRGRGQAFQPTGRRHLALVNKSSNLLRKSCNVMAEWRDNSNLRFVKSKSGTWMERAVASSCTQS